MKKGISPLVATVLLIAVTMTLAGILAFWGSSFVRTGLPSEEETEQFKRCSTAVGSLKVDFSFYNETAKTFFISIYNLGPARLRLTNATFFYSTNSITKTIDAISQPGTSVTFLLDGIEPGFIKYIVYTDCPGVTLEVKA
ncbi:MAG: archaellin/type IV pilin N-terminal domain-containing protein [Candidatus Aenigmatarchaeota archaeon]